MRERSSFVDRWLKGPSSVFVRGFGRSCTAKDLRTQFNWYGVIIDIHIPRVRSVSRGFEFVHFKKEEDVEYLLNLNPEIKVGERKVFFARARRHGLDGAKRKTPMKLLDPKKGSGGFMSSVAGLGSDESPKSFREAHMNKASVSGAVDIVEIGSGSGIRSISCDLEDQNLVLWL